MLRRLLALALVAASACRIDTEIEVASATDAIVETDDIGQPTGEDGDSGSGSGSGSESGTGTGTSTTGEPGAPPSPPAGFDAMPERSTMRPSSPAVSPRRAPEPRTQAPVGPPRAP